MNPNAIFEMVMGQGIFAALFVWLFFTYQKESKERENRLMSVVDRQTEKLDTITGALEKISCDLRDKRVSK